jgi:signal transduction histidine kinase
VRVETGPLPPVEADPDRLSQVLDNFIENALRYAPEGPIVVRARIRRDADARAAAGEFDQPTIAVRCTDRPGGGGARVLLECLAISSQNTRVRVGQPFFVAASLRDGRYAWCHVNPPPAEGSAGLGVFVPLAKACTG